MATALPTRVLIVDDSRVFRNIMEKIISSTPGFQVVGGVGKGTDALEFLRLRTVDLMTLDVDMPDMDGIQALEEMSVQKSSFKATPDVLVVSSYTQPGTDLSIKALELGAFDIIGKPGSDKPNAHEYLTQIVRNAINAWKNKRCPVPPPPLPPTAKVAAAASEKAEAQALADGVAKIVTTSGFAYTLAKPSPHTKPVQAIVLGVSTGGPKSLSDMLPKLCAVTDLPVILVQHMPPNFTKSLASSLDVKCRHKVVEGGPGMVVEPKHVYIAPGGAHMTVRARGGDFVLETNQDPPENGCRPSVDVLFRSAARAYPSDTLIGIILTGMGNDGTPALPSLKQRNAYLIAQNEESSVVFGMPRAAAATGLLDKVVSLMRVPDAVLERIEMVVK
ncbi:MAG: chemotaxis-specific protein-glutamate methyltransferase CheB [Acidobacteriota bacterium]|nr:chemotaxis-specific protein-glutamate methyltransferase CheB [Acidobacteriota bacterium]